MSTCWRRSLILTLSLALLPLAAARAQAFEQTVPLDSRLRVHAPDLAARPFVGRLAQILGDTFVVRTDGRRGVFAAGSIERLEVSLGRPERRRYALTGAVVGLAVGAVLGREVARHCVAVDYGSGGRDRAKCYAAVGGIVVAPATLIGAIAGESAARERWEPVPLPTPR